MPKKLRPEGFISVMREEKPSPRGDDGFLVGGILSAESGACVVDHSVHGGSETFFGVVGTSLDLGLDRGDPIVRIDGTRLKTRISTCLSGKFHGILGSSSESVGLGLLGTRGRFAEIRPLKASR